MADTFGAKVSQLGHDVKVAPDFSLLFNSLWPLLKIEAQGAFSMDAAVSSTIYTHNLGYQPMFLIFKNRGTSSELVSPGNDLYGDQFNVNTTQLNFGAGGGSTGAYDGYYYVFRNKILTPFAAPIVNSASDLTNVIEDFGLKATVAGKDVRSTDLRDFAVHSDTRSPMIHQVVPGDLTFNGTDYSLVATHDLGYSPFYMCYVSSGGPTYFSFYGGNSNTILTLTSSTITIRSTSAGLKGSIVVFKDPFFL